MLLEVLQFPDKKLRNKAWEVKADTPEIKKLAQDMLETMYHHEGIGLSATQVGRSESVFVYDVSKGRKDPRMLANPYVLYRSAKHDIISKEGCLSFGRDSGERLTIPVPRYSVFVIKAFDIKKKKHVEIKPKSDAELVCIQHEMDHLIGRMIFDHLEQAEREEVMDIFYRRRYYA